MAVHAAQRQLRSLAITKLMSEQPDDGLEVYDTQSGDLLAAFTGRWDPADLPEIRSTAMRSRSGGPRIATTRTRSASLEDVGFEATASAGMSAPNTGCSPTSGAEGAVRRRSRRRRRSERDCGEYDSVTGGAGMSAYAPNSRCGWRITSTTDYVELKFLELAIENGFDFVRIYAGSTAPTGFSLTEPAAEPAVRGGDAPPTPCRRSSAVAAPVFVTLESDGLGNTAVSARGRRPGARRPPPRATRARPRPAPGRRRSRTARLGLCTGARRVPAAGAARPRLDEVQSSPAGAEAATDYPAMTTCRWKFTLAEATNLKGLSFRAKKARRGMRTETTWRAWAAARARPPRPRRAAHRGAR